VLIVPKHCELSNGRFIPFVIGSIITDNADGKLRRNNPESLGKVLGEWPSISGHFVDLE